MRVASRARRTSQVPTRLPESVHRLLLPPVLPPTSLSLTRVPTPRSSRKNFSTHRCRARSMSAMYQDLGFASTGCRECPVSWPDAITCVPIVVNNAQQTNNGGRAAGAQGTYGAVNRKGAPMVVSALPVSWIWLEVAFLALQVRLTLAREATTGVASRGDGWVSSRQGQARPGG